MHEKNNGIASEIVATCEILFELTKKIDKIIILNLKMLIQPPICVNPSPLRSRIWKWRRQDSNQLSSRYDHGRNTLWQCAIRPL